MHAFYLEKQPWIQQDVMSAIIMAAGIILLLIVIFDIAVTVFVSKGAGFYTRFITLSVAWIFKLLVQNRGYSKLLEYKVVFIIGGMVSSWITLSWIGTALIYASDYDSVINGQSGVAAYFIEKVYFTGYTLSTLGQGDFIPSGYFWEIYTSIASFVGFIIITICITYIVPVISNIAQKNKLALKIASLGESTEKILINGYNGNDFSSFTAECDDLADDIFLYAENHTSYPILHHVHNHEKNQNIILKLMSIDEACNILLRHVPEQKIKEKLAVQQVRHAITVYLRSVRNISPADIGPDLPDFKGFSHALGFQLINTRPDDLQRIYSKLEYRRCLFLAIIKDDGFDWDDLEGDLFDSKYDYH